MTNLEVLKCPHAAFCKEGLITNIGSYISLLIILLFIILCIIFYKKDFNKLKKQINNILVSKRAPVKKNNNSKINIISKNSNSSLSILNSANIHLFKRSTKMRQKIIKEDKNKIIQNINKKLNKESNKNIKTNYIVYNDFELNTLNYKEALKYDKRTYFQYYWSLLKIKQIIIFTFFPVKDYNSFIIKFNLFCFSFLLSYSVNALFFNEPTMHKIYIDKGSYNFIYHIPQIIYSTIISKVINSLLKLLSLSQRNILEIKNETKINEIIIKKQKILKCLKIKFILFYTISLIFLFFFWYYLSCFCAVYKNTQYQLLEDTVISYALSLLYPFGLSLFPGIFRIPSLKDKKNNKECMYRMSKIIQII